MAEGNGAAAPEGNGAAKKPKAEVTEVTMKDGTTEKFVGKRNLNKDATVGADGSVTGTFALRNGDKHSITLAAGDPLLARLAAHGLVQKGGDEAAGLKVEGTNEPDLDSMSMAIEEVLKRMADTSASLDDRWYAATGEGSGFSGASVVVQAIAEATGLSVDKVKENLSKMLEAGKNDKPPLTRQRLYASFRKPGSTTAGIIERLEKERAAGMPAAVDADAEIARMRQMAGA